MPVIMKDNFQYAYTTKGTVFHTLSNAEYEALSEEEKMNGDVYCIPDREPILNPDQVWAKLGTEPLDTEAEDVSGAVNELNSSLNNVLYSTDILTYNMGSITSGTPVTWNVPNVIPSGFHIVGITTILVAGSGYIYGSNLILSTDYTQIRFMPTQNMSGVQARYSLQYKKN